MIGSRIQSRFFALLAFGLFAVLAPFQRFCIAGEGAIIEVRLIDDEIATRTSGQNIKLALSIPEAVRLALPELSPKNFKVYVFPESLTQEKGMAEEFRAYGVFLWQYHDSVFLDVRNLPKVDKSGKYSVLVSCVLNDTEVARAKASTRLKAVSGMVDVVLVIDSSLSMVRTDRKRKRIAAARAFIDMASRGSRIERIGVVSFNNKARILSPLTSVKQKDILLESLKHIDEDGQTNMDRAFKATEEVLVASTINRRAVVFLTDGRNEPGRYEGSHKVLQDRCVPVFAIGLSGKADHQLLEKISTDTGGKSFNADNSERLLSIYQQVASEIGKNVILFSEPVSGRKTDIDVPIDSSIHSANFVFDGDDGTDSIELYTPDGTLASPGKLEGSGFAAFSNDDNYQFRRVISPTPGDWNVTLKMADENLPRNLTVAAETGLYLDMFPPQIEGRKMTLAVTLAAAGKPITSGRIKLMSSPEGLSETFLYDDGEHADGAADDGVYACSVELPVGEIGNLPIRMRAWGSTSGGERYIRQTGTGLKNIIVSPVISKSEIKPKLLAGCSAFNNVIPGEVASAEIDLTLVSSVARKLTSRSFPLYSGKDSVLPASAVIFEFESGMSLAPGRSTLSINIKTSTDTRPGEYTGYVDFFAGDVSRRLALRFTVDPVEVDVDPSPLDFGIVKNGYEYRHVLTLTLDSPKRLPFSIELDGSAKAEVWFNHHEWLSPNAQGSVGVDLRIPYDLKSGKYSDKINLVCGPVRKVVFIKFEVQGDPEELLPDDIYTVKLPPRKKPDSPIEKSQLTENKEIKPPVTLKVEPELTSIPILSEEGDAWNGVKPYVILGVVVAVLFLALLIIILRKVVRNRMARYAMLAVLANAFIIFAFVVVLAPESITNVIKKPKIIARLVNIKKRMGISLSDAEERLLQSKPVNDIAEMRKSIEPHKLDDKRDRSDNDLYKKKVTVAEKIPLRIEDKARMDDVEPKRFESERARRAPQIVRHTESNFKSIVKKDTQKLSPMIHVEEPMVASLATMRKESRKLSSGKTQEDVRRGKSLERVSSNTLHRPEASLRTPPRRSVSSMRLPQVQLIRLTVAPVSNEKKKMVKSLPEAVSSIEPRYAASLNRPDKVPVKNDVRTVSAPSRVSMVERASPVNNRIVMSPSNAIHSFRRLHAPVLNRRSSSSSSKIERIDDAPHMEVMPKESLHREHFSQSVGVASPVSEVKPARRLALSSVASDGVHRAMPIEREYAGGGRKDGVARRSTSRSSVKSPRMPNLKKLVASVSSPSVSQRKIAVAQGNFTARAVDVEPGVSLNDYRRAGFAKLSGAVAANRNGFAIQRAIDVTPSRELPEKLPKPLRVGPAIPKAFSCKQAEVVEQASGAMVKGRHDLSDVVRFAGTKWQDDYGKVRAELPSSVQPIGKGKLVRPGLTNSRISANHEPSIPSLTKPITATGKPTLTQGKRSDIERLGRVRRIAVSAGRLASPSAFRCENITDELVVGGDKRRVAVVSGAVLAAKRDRTTNLVMMREGLRPRTTPLSAEVASVKSRSSISTSTSPGELSVVIGQVKFGSDWNSSPRALVNLVDFFSNNIDSGVKVRKRVVRLDRKEISDCPVLVMTGNLPFTLSEGEIRALRSYLSAGGLLWINDSTAEGDNSFDVSFRREIVRVVSTPLRRINNKHALFRTGYDFSNGYNGYDIPPGDKYRAKYLEAIEIKGRIAILYTRNDYADGMAIDPGWNPVCPSLTDLSAEDMQRGALMFGANVICYSLGIKPQSAKVGVGALSERPLGRNFGKLTIWQDFTGMTDETLLWKVVESWGNPAKVSYYSNGGKEGALRIDMHTGQKHKVAVKYDIPAHEGRRLDISGAKAMVLDIYNGAKGGFRFSAVLTTVGGDLKWRDYESKSIYLRPGWNKNIIIPIANDVFKTRETGWKNYDSPPKNLDKCGKITFLFYNRGQISTAVLIDNIRFENIK